MKRPRIVVTGLGVVSSIGIGWKAFWDSLLAGRSGIRAIRYLDTSRYPTRYGGEVGDFEPLEFMPESVANQLGRCAQFAIAATKMALEDARLMLQDAQRLRTGVCLGTTMAEIQVLEAINQTWVTHDERKISSSLVVRCPSCTISANVAANFGFGGPNLVIPTACAAGNYAIGYAVDLLRAGRADIMVAGGTDPFSRIGFTGFNRLFALAPERCQPFDKNRQGTLIGEGTGILVLEPLEAAIRRSAPIYGEVLGCGYSCDGHHMTMPEVDGIGRVMRNALRDAEIEPQDIDYISAHGTGTPANDKAECAAIHRVFGERGRTIPVSSIKSMLGHTMGAASALEAIACVLTVHHNHIPPTINFETSDPECDIDCVPNVSRQYRVNIALNNSFAFGGNNACLVFQNCKKTA
jgi:3-oxoacyl-[acyl-carrier-protein] synthase II